MNQQISLETAADVWRKKCGDLYTANLVLEVRIGELEAELDQLRPAPNQHPPAAGPDVDQRL